LWDLLPHALSSDFAGWCYGKDFRLNGTPGLFRRIGNEIKQFGRNRQRNKLPQGRQQHWWHQLRAEHQYRIWLTARGLEVYDSELGAGVATENSLDQRVIACNMPFQKGNNLAAKDKLFARTLKRALDQDDGKKLRACAEKVLELAVSGERWACEMLRDTLDGRPATAIVATDSDGKELTIGLVAFGPDARPDPPVQLPAEGLPAPVIEGTVRRH